MSTSLIRCNLCGEPFYSVEVFERHLDECKLPNQPHYSNLTQHKVIPLNNQEYVIWYQEIVLNGKNQMKNFKSRKLASDENLQDNESDEDLTEPSRTSSIKICRLSSLSKKYSLWNTISWGQRITCLSYMPKICI